MDAVPRDDSGNAETPMWLIPSRKALPTVDRTKFAPASEASTPGWDRYVGNDGAVVGMHTFGASAAHKQLPVEFGVTPTR